MSFEFSSYNIELLLWKTNSSSLTESLIWSTAFFFNRRPFLEFFIFASTSCLKNNIRTVRPLIFTVFFYRSTKDVTISIFFSICTAGTTFIGNKETIRKSSFMAARLCFQVTFWHSVITLHTFCICAPFTCGSWIIFIRKGTLCHVIHIVFRNWSGTFRVC